MKPDVEETTDENATDLDAQLSVVDVTPSPVPPVNLDAIESDTTLSLVPPPPPPPKEILQLIDVTPYLR